jgi:hypothetical protein
MDIENGFDSVWPGPDSPSAYFAGGKKQAMI